MVKKISGKERNRSEERNRKPLHAKRLRLKSLHRDVAGERAELENLRPDELPPASSSNAARQARSRLNITFPVNWQDLHLDKARQDQESGQPDTEETT